MPNQSLADCVEVRDCSVPRLPAPAGLRHSLTLAEGCVLARLGSRQSMTTPYGRRRAEGGGGRERVGLFVVAADRGRRSSALAGAGVIPAAREFAVMRVRVGSTACLHCRNTVRRRQGRHRCPLLSGRSRGLRGTAVVEDRPLRARRRSRRRHRPTRSTPAKSSGGRDTICSRRQARTSSTVPIREQSSLSIGGPASEAGPLLSQTMNGSHNEYKARPITKPTGGERILAFDMVGFPSDSGQGVSKNWKRLHKQLLRPNVCEFINRMDAECSDTHKQVLTYVMVTRKGSVLAYKRGNYNRVEDF